MSKTALFNLFALALGLLLVTGCAADSGEDLTGDNGGENVLVDGTTDPANSCFGLCGMYDATKPCQCDALCHANGDCCTDFCSMCTTASNFADACQGNTGCTPECAGKLCGDDGCGGSCGDCAAGTSCDANGACVATCGNGVCDAGEDATNCAADCAPAPVCGNGVCDAGEDATNCAQDCAETEVIDSCVGRCDNGYDEAASCQCDPGCMEFGDCCNDLCDNCGADPDFAVYCGTCTPSCDGKVCGDDGCGGECGPGCAANETCTDAGTCEADVVECTPACDGKVCGDDGCGGECGPGCDDGETCTDAGACEGTVVDPPECVPACEPGWECGDDGCGGSCNGGCPKVAPICDANFECQLTFTVNPCWDQECPAEVEACKADIACGSLALCLAEAPDPLNSNCYASLQDQYGEEKAQEVAELYNGIQYCGWSKCANTEGTCEDQCGDYVGPTACNCDTTVCIGAEGQCEGDPSNPVDGEVYGCTFYGDCCQDYEALCDSEPECTPQCDGKECGDDGCGGACGDGCGPDAICTDDGLCESTCVPTCGDTGAVCGPDGCGGSCGACDDGLGCDETGQCTITLEDGTCTSFFADQCGDDENCFVLAGEGACIAAGSGGDGAFCELDADCAKGTLCLDGACTTPECDVAGEFAPCPGDLSCVPYYQFNAETGETAYTDFGACYDGCAPFGLNTCGPGKQCITVSTEPLQGICVEWEVGAGQVGDSCDGDTALCDAGLICVTMSAGEAICWDSCALAAEGDEPGSCPDGQTCDPLYSGDTGAPLAFGFCQAPECTAAGDLCTLGTTNDEGFLCIDDGFGQGLCQLSCLPYIGDAICPADQWCEPLDLDDGGTCQDIPAAGGNLGDSCDNEITPCDAELTCVAGTCKLLCDPNAEADAEGACIAGESCAGLSGVDGLLSYGSCSQICDYHGGDTACDVANEVCLPTELLVKSDADVCSPENHPDFPIEVGAVCPDGMGYCAEGAICAADSFGIANECTQICFLVNGLLENPDHPDCTDVGAICNDIGMDDWGLCQ